MIFLKKFIQITRIKQSDRKDTHGFSTELSTSWIALKSSDGTEFTASVLQAVNGMLLDMLAAVARKDYEVRRRRQTQGIEKT